jgi:hypothetical protein
MRADGSRLFRRLRNHWIVIAADPHSLVSPSLQRRFPFGRLLVAFLAGPRYGPPMLGILNHA